MITRSVLAFSDGAAGPLFAREDTGKPGWRDLAECQYTDPEIFFPERGGSAQAPKRICRSCAARVGCLSYALETAQQWGVWGGFSELQLRKLRQSGRTAAEIVAADEEKHHTQAEVRAAA